MLTAYNIPLNDLKSGATEYDWNITEEFFKSFDNAEILSASVDVTVVVRKVSGNFLLDCRMSGELAVPCDRCLDELVLPVDAEVGLKLQYSKADVDEEDGREVVEIPQGCEFDMSQVIYDYVCLCIPIQHCHEDGGCNPEVVKHLTGQGTSETPAVESNAFSSLKDLFEK